MNSNQQDIIDLVSPYLANPGLIFGGSHYMQRATNADMVAGVLERNPDLQLGGVRIEGKGLAERYLKGIGRLNNFVGGDGQVAAQGLSRIGCALVGQHGCNPWEAGTAKVMEMLNTISVMGDPPLDLVRAVIEHPCAPGVAQIEKEIETFESGHHAPRKQGPIHHACSENRPDLVRFWLAMGFGVHARDEGGRLPIALASSAEVARVLLDAGSAITQVDRRDNGVMEAWRGSLSASAMEQMGKEVARAIDKGKVAGVDRDLLLEMARGMTARRKIEEMMKTSGIGWWDTHEDGPIARLAIVDMLARYGEQPGFVQDRTRSLISSAVDAARRERVDLGDFDRGLLWFAGKMIEMDNIKVAQPTSGLLHDVFVRVLELVPFKADTLLMHAQQWHKAGLIEDASAVDLLVKVSDDYRDKVKGRMGYASTATPDFPAAGSGVGQFIHKQLPQMILRLPVAQQAKALPAMIVLANDFFGRAVDGAGFGTSKTAPGGLHDALVSLLNARDLAEHANNKALQESIKFVQTHRKLYSRAGDAFHALLSSYSMGALAPKPSKPAQAARAPRF